MLKIQTYKLICLNDYIYVLGSKENIRLFSSTTINLFTNNEGNSSDNESTTSESTTASGLVEKYCNNPQRTDLICYRQTKSKC